MNYQYVGYCFPHHSYRHTTKDRMSIYIQMKTEDIMQYIDVDADLFIV